MRDEPLAFIALHVVQAYVLPAASLMAAFYGLWFGCHAEKIPEFGWSQFSALGSMMGFTQGALALLFASSGRPETGGLRKLATWKAMVRTVTSLMWFWGAGFLVAGFSAVLGQPPPFVFGIFVGAVLVALIWTLRTLVAISLFAAQFYTAGGTSRST